MTKEARLALSAVETPAGPTVDQAVVVANGRSSQNRRMASLIADLSSTRAIRVMPSLGLASARSAVARY